MLVKITANQSSKEDKKLLFCWVAQGLQVLVTKRRGKGFLKTPYGHHANEGLDEIEAAAHCNLFGLDGALRFDCDRIFFGGDEKRKNFLETIVPMLEAHYGYKAIEIGELEFWELNPRRRNEF